VTPPLTAPVLGTPTGEAPSGPRAPSTPPAVEQVAGPASGCDLAGAPLLTSAPGTGRTVALTFDDGPGPYTRRVLDILRGKGVHATFFVIGEQVGPAVQTVAEVAGAGNQVAGHSWDHVYPTEVPWTVAHVRTQLRTTSAAVEAATDRPACWFRPPGGFLTGVAASVQAERMRAVLWSTDPQDWRTSQAGTTYSVAAQGIYRRALSTSAHPIVLMHDGGGRRGATVAALPHVIDWYRAHGYTFVRIDGRR
jgi:peptidoglycan/xylan/chitin deacetylase (PgdA/CDA1 family)